MVQRKKNHENKAINEFDVTHENIKAKKLFMSSKIAQCVYNMLSLPLRVRACVCDFCSTHTHTRQIKLHYNKYIYKYIRLAQCGETGFFGGYFVFLRIT